MISKQSRSRAKNPEQEKLREEKAEWNEDASSTIQKLISLKKGLNGKGDTKNNLPPSRIHEVMPSEIVSHLSETDLDAKELFQDAREIVRHQNEYAQKTASTQLSRLWSKIWLFGTLNKFIYNNRIRMLNEAVGIQKTLRKIQKELLEQDPESLALAFTEAALLRAQFMGPFINNYNQMFEKYVELSKNYPKLIEKSEEIPEIKNEIVEKKEQLPKEKEILSPPSDEAIILKMPEKSTSEKLKDLVLKKSEDQKIIQLAKDEKVFISACIKWIFASTKPDNSERSLIENYNNNLIRALVALAVLEEKKDEDANIILDKEKLQNEIINSYNNLLDIARNKIGPGENFKEIFANINPKNKKAFFSESLIKVASIEKEAKESIFNWLKRKILSINPDSFQRLALDSVRLASKTERSLNSLMDGLEDRKETIQALDVRLAHFARLLKLLIENLIVLSKMQFSNVRRVERGKDWNKINIRAGDVQELQRFSDELEEYTKTFNFENV